MVFVPKTVRDLFYPKLFCFLKTRGMPKLVMHFPSRYFAPKHFLYFLLGNTYSRSQIGFIEYIYETPASILPARRLFSKKERFHRETELKQLPNTTRKVY